MKIFPVWGINRYIQKKKKTITWPAFTSRDIWQGYYFILFGSSLTWKHTGGEGVEWKHPLDSTRSLEGCNPSGSGAGGKEEVNTELHGNKKKKEKHHWVGREGTGEVTLSGGVCVWSLDTRSGNDVCVRKGIVLGEMRLFTEDGYHSHASWR